jgi:hypothetical protein
MQLVPFLIKTNAVRIYVFCVACSYSLSVVLRESPSAAGYCDPLDLRTRSSASPIASSNSAKGNCDLPMSVSIVPGILLTVIGVSSCSHVASMIRLRPTPTAFTWRKPNASICFMMVVFDTRHWYRPKLTSTRYRLLKRKVNELIGGIARLLMTTIVRLSDIQFSANECHEGILFIHHGLRTLLIDSLITVLPDRVSRASVEQPQN